ncbi:hypothetical protein PUN28_012161 [Cardiocondyla obscurior]|uniref:Uncharacterized protein n=1 Tax=Cardiocondyla obscurior TaxID=286306 RepID=A0AAW2FCQ4_9HYME
MSLNQNCALSARREVQAGKCTNIRLLVCDKFHHSNKDSNSTGLPRCRTSRLDSACRKTHIENLAVHVSVFLDAEEEDILARARNDSR